jgi:hypothetical protein
LRLAGLEEHVVGIVNLLVEVALVLEETLDVHSSFIDDHASDLGGKLVAKYLLNRGVDGVTDVGAAGVTFVLVKNVHVDLGHGDGDEGGLLGTLARHGLGLLLEAVALVLGVVTGSRTVVLVVIASTASTASTVVASGSTLVSTTLVVIVVVATALSLVVGTPILTGTTLLVVVGLSLLLLVVGVRLVVASVLL